ncbi:hypothetical protein EUX98_g5033 [Antrodiella citrinella]|uniref:Uncharacterized protein n=1 Tax=Antrodiella citrinella TaxID=2447956 RepID=A0A4S4MV11_9APHY|nr:hypothetical protein EUX98_g5033 [Antrodiella citrinella]
MEILYPKADVNWPGEEICVPGRSNAALTTKFQLRVLQYCVPRIPADVDIVID